MPFADVTGVIARILKVAPQVEMFLPGATLLVHGPDWLA